MIGKGKAGASEALATHFARKGLEAVAELQATVDRAHEMLATGEIQSYGKGENSFEQPP